MDGKIEKKIIINFLYQIFGKVITSFVGFIVSVLIARHLGLLGFGQYNLIFTFLGLAGIIADFGLATLLIREVAAGRGEEKFFAGVFSLRLILNILVILILLVVFPFLPYSEIVKRGIILALLGNVFLSLSSVIWAVYQARLKFFNVVVIQVLSCILTALLVIFGVTKQKPLLFFVFANVAGNFAGFILSLKTLKNLRVFFIFDKKLFGKIVNEVWPIALWAIVSTFYFKIDSIILASFYNPLKTSDLGLYSAAYKYFEVVGVFFGFFQLTVFPVVSARLKKKNFSDLLKRLVLMTIILAIAATLSLLTLSTFLIGFYGSQFSPAVSALRILSLSSGLSVLSGIWLAIAIAGGKQRQILAFSIMALFLNIVLNFWAIPKFSYLGASWVTVLTQLFITVTDFIVAQKILISKENDGL